MATPWAARLASEAMTKQLLRGHIGVYEVSQIDLATLPVHTLLYNFLC